MIECAILGNALATLLCAQCIVGACPPTAPAQAPALQAPASARGEPATYTITVSTASRAEIPRESLTIELLEVKDDRCALEVKCVWAGEAKVTLRTSAPGSDPASLVISTVAPPSGAAGGTYGPYRFSLLRLEPANSIAKPANQADYRATLRVSNR